MCALCISLAENFNLGEKLCLSLSLNFGLLPLEILPSQIIQLKKKKNKSTKHLVEMPYLMTGKAQSSWDDPSRSFASHGYNTKHES